MKTFIIFLILFAALPLKLFASEILQLAKGETHYLPLNGSVWIEDAKTIKAKPERGQLAIRALAEGESLLRIGQRTWQISVLSQRALELLKYITQEVQVTAGLKVNVKEGAIRIEGKLFQMKEWLDLMKVCKEAHVVMAAELRPELKNQIQKYINARLSSENLPAQTLLFNDEWQIRLPKADQRIARFEKTLSAFGIRVLADDESLETKPIINIKITVAEVRKDYARKIGIRWPSSYSASILPDSKVENGSLLFSAEALEAEGYGRILASPQLISRSGSEATFLAGGEIPIKVMNYKNQSVEWKQYGISLKVLPTADSSGRMSIKIDTEISSVDESHKVDDLPSFVRNKVSTHFDLLKTQTVVISGLLKNDQAQQSEGLPGLSRLPILGALFASKDFRENRTELIIMVRPEIITPDQMMPEHSARQHLEEIR